MQQDSPAIVGDEDGRGGDVDLGSVLVEGSIEAIEELYKSRNRPTFASVDGAASEDRCTGRSGQVAGRVLGRLGHSTTVRVHARFGVANETKLPL